jgi:hypothetical protein
LLCRSGGGTGKAFYSLEGMTGETGEVVSRESWFEEVNALFNTKLIYKDNYIPLIQSSIMICPNCKRSTIPGWKIIAYDNSIKLHHID